MVYQRATSCYNNLRNIYRPGKGHTWYFTISFPTYSSSADSWRQYKLLPHTFTLSHHTLSRAADVTSSSSRFTIYHRNSMARKKKAAPTRQNYSRDLKRRVIYQAHTLQKTSTEIAISLDMPLRVVQRVRQVWSEIGEVCRDRTRMGRAPIMKPVAVDVSHYLWCHWVSALIFHSHRWCLLCSSTPQISI